MLPVLKFSVDNRSVREAIEKFSTEFGLTEAERQQTLASGKPLIRSRVEWAVTYLAQAGLLSRPERGHFKITDSGIRVLQSAPSAIDRAFLKQFPDFIDFLNRSRPAGTETDEAQSDADSQNALTPEEKIELAASESEAGLKRELIDRVLEQSPEFFERLVVALLSAMGYGNEGTLAKAVGRVGDGGIDGLIHQDKLGLDVVYVQAKRYQASATVGRPELQAFVGALAGVGAQKGVFVTTSKFSPHALSFIQTVHQRIILIDGDRLVELMIEHGVGVRLKRSIALHRIDEDFFAE